MHGNKISNQLSLYFITMTVVLNPDLLLVKIPTTAKRDVLPVLQYWNIFRGLRDKKMNFNLIRIGSQLQTATIKDIKKLKGL